MVKSADPQHFRRAGISPPTRSLARWEPRILVDSVDAFPDANGHMRVTVKYTIRSTDSEQDLSVLLNPGA